MNFKEKTADELIERRNAIAEEIEAPEADLDALEEEVRAINEELEARKNEEAKKAELRAAVAQGEGEVVKKIEPEERKVKTMEEIRNSKEYIEAYAEYVKSDNDAECRALLTENVSGTVPVPEIVYDIVKNAWEKEGIMALVKKTYIKGNLKVGFEVSADGAVVHTEGAAAPTEEKLALGVVKLIPASIKKWITISDEVVDMDSGAFIQYVYDELTYQIAKKAADELIAKIEACGTVSTNTPSVNVAVPKVEVSAIGLGTIASAIAELSDQAANPVIMMNKTTWGAFKAVQAAGSYGYDPFEGLPVLFNNTITAYSAATTGVTFAIVGDLGEGAIANFPNGEEIKFTYDGLSFSDADLVKLVGREYVALGVVGPKSFVKIVKAADA